MEIHVNRQQLTHESSVRTFNILCIFWWANPIHWLTLSLETVK